MCMRVAVLGARGLIGGAVVRRAILAGHHVRAIVRPGGGVAGFPAGTEVIAADLRSRESGVDAVRRMEVVVHAASVAYPEWPRQVQRLADNAFAAAAATGATLVFPGNVYVYGRPRSRFVTEDHPQEPHTVKGRVRLAVERRLLQAHQDGRVDLVLPRYPDVYGPGGMHDDVRPRLRRRAHREAVPMAARCRRAPRIHSQRRRGRSDAETPRDARGARPGGPRPRSRSDRVKGLHSTRLQGRRVGRAHRSGLRARDVPPGRALQPDGPRRIP